MAISSLWAAYLRKPALPPDSSAPLGYIRHAHVQEVRSRQSFRRSDADNGIDLLRRSNRMKPKECHRRSMPLALNSLTAVSLERTHDSEKLRLLK